MNDNVKTVTVLPPEQVEELRRILQDTDYALVKKDRVRTLAVRHVLGPQELARPDIGKVEEGLFRAMSRAISEELLDNGAMKQRIAPLVSVDGSRAYELRLDVLMPKEAAP